MSPTATTQAPLRLAVLASGAGTTAARVIGAAATMRAEVCLVISNNSGAGALEHAREHGVPGLHLNGVTHPDPAERDATMAAALEAAGADLVVLAGFMKKIGPLVLERWAGRVVNTHPALLPAYGGVGMYGDRVHAAVLADGASVTGASVHVVTAEYDEGPVLAQAEVRVVPDDDVASLRERVQAAEKELLVGWLAQRCGEL